MKNMAPKDTGMKDTRSSSNKPSTFGDSNLIPILREEDQSDFDWFKSYKDLAELLHELIPEEQSRILMLGCGNSKLSEDMWEDGYRNIVNTDYSGVLVEKMKQRHGQVRPEMEWHEMDVRDLKFGDGTFDVAIDKGKRPLPGLPGGFY
ncbi:hypothetical protein D9756_002231 [Leucocoprinus leucothites]|uniref:Methyltransferase domain-containing protein n=1 Tax=Leucocoprinus leucothites TaxID=201217 RepID=A0A8H5GCJ0_9AGAR|nr:hypothetical protein D9756_002231 [Leucoagaricus leucothites]